MSNTKLNCCKCGKDLGFSERIYNTGDLWCCEDCAIKEIQESHEKDKKITNLEAKLAEKEEAIKYLNGIKRYDIGELLNENIKLKQELSEKEKKIKELKGERLKFYTDDVRRTQVINGVHFDIEQLLVFSEYVEHEKWLISNRDKEIEELKKQFAEKDKEIKQLKLDLGMFKSVNEFINKYGIDKAREVLLQSEKTKKQDKISFAVEQLENVRNYIITDEKDMFGVNYLMKPQYVLEYIDNQIEELKKEMK